MSKQVTVIPATGGAYRDLSIEPGTTAQDIKKALSLPNETVLTRGKGSEPIADDANIYETVSDGAKLYATTSVEWGGALVEFLSYLFAPPKTQVRVTRTYRSPDSESFKVCRHPLPYWAERGWVRDGQTYSGDYKTDFGRWPGWISVSSGGRVETYIASPPKALERHPHWECFRKRDEGWYFIHPVREVPDVSAAILAVEKTLTEAFTGN